MKRQCLRDTSLTGIRKSQSSRRPMTVTSRAIEKLRFSPSARNITSTTCMTDHFLERFPIGFLTCIPNLQTCAKRSSGMIPQSVFSGRANVRTKCVMLLYLLCYGSVIPVFQQDESRINDRWFRLLEPVMDARGLYPR